MVLPEVQNLTKNFPLVKSLQNFLSVAIFQKLSSPARGARVRFCTSGYYVDLIHCCRVCLFNPSDIRLAEFKYVRFQNTQLKLDERKVQEFQSTLIESILPGHRKSDATPPQHYQSSSNLNTNGNRTVKIPETSFADPTAVKVTTSAWDWTQADIQHWFEQQYISTEIRDLYQFRTGAQMITYAECLTDGWHRQYERYAPRYTQQNPGRELPEHEFALFVSSLKQLASKYRDSLLNLRVY